jgi:hypothetical protein
MITRTEEFSQIRRGQINGYPATVRSAILNCEERWGQVLYTPLAIPKFYDEGLIDWYFENAKPVYKIKQDVATNRVGHSGFISINVYPNGVPRDTGIWSINDKSEWVYKFPKMYQQIMDTLPFKKIQSLQMWSSTNRVAAHTDHSAFIDCPLSFRIMLYDENPGPTLALQESLPDDNWDTARPFYCEVPEETNSFVWNNLRTKHGSTHDPKYRKVLAIIQNGDIDWIKLDRLLEKSTGAFDNRYQLLSSRPINDFITHDL